MRKIVPLDQLEQYVGKSLGHSEWMLIDQDRVNAFAEVTNDHQFIHVDPEAAAKTPIGGPVAHGFLSLSLLSYLTADLGVVPEGVVMGINYGFDKVRFLQPVRVGSEIRASSILLDVNQEKPGQVMMKSAVTVEIRDQAKPALVAEWLALMVCA